MKINIPETDQERVVIIGGGFAGLTLAKKLTQRNYQVVLIDKNNYHQFQPLFYQHLRPLIHKYWQFHS